MTFSTLDVVDLAQAFAASWGAGALLGYVFEWGRSLFKSALD